MSAKELAPNYFTRKRAISQSLGKGSRVLNIGCGDGDYDQALSKNFSSVFGIDVNLADLLIAKQRNPRCLYALASAEQLPFKSNAFDEAICADVLEHVDSDAAALNEASRVLKKRARLLLTVPNLNFTFPHDPINFVLQRLSDKYIPIGLWGFGHKRLYTPALLKAKLAAAGFSVLKLQAMLHWFAGIFENYYLVNLLQPLTKTSRRNVQVLEKKRPRLSRKAPSFLERLRNWVIRTDERIAGSSEKCLQFFVEARKR